jgi:small subunit ribosomal protein S2
MMTNFTTIRRSVKKMNNIDRMLTDGAITNITKKERLTLSRERIKMDRVLGGIANLNRLPSAVFIVDILNEHLAVDEAERLGIRTFAMVDTNSDPNRVDFPIPSNDDSSKSIALITQFIVDAIKEGLAEKAAEGEGKEEAAS